MGLPFFRFPTPKIKLFFLTTEKSLGVFQCNTPDLTQWKNCCERRRYGRFLKTTTKIWTNEN